MCVKFQFKLVVEYVDLVIIKEFPLKIDMIASAKDIKSI